MNHVSFQLIPARPILFLSAAFLTCCAGASAIGQTLPSDRQKLSVEAPGLQIERQGNRLFVHMDAEPAEKTVAIPRIYASLVSVHFLDQDPHEDLIVHPEPNEWLVRWKPSVTFAKDLVLTFDGPPWLADEIKPIHQAGDGTLTMHACQATTHGEKLRFEPQPHKNTVGYWAVATDFATWKLHVDRPGEFNVGILQGCGQGQGGSEAELIVRSSLGNAATLEFTTVDTGHFQNFIWRDLGKIQMEQAGDYELMIKPTRIAKGALMDVRMLHLSPAK